jgi:hypothetical protein
VAIAIAIALNRISRLATKHERSARQRQRIFEHVPRGLFGAVGLDGTPWSFDGEGKDTTRGSTDPDPIEDRCIDVVGFGMAIQEVFWW